MTERYSYPIKVSIALVCVAALVISTILVLRIWNHFGEKQKISLLGHQEDLKSAVKWIGTYGTMKAYSAVYDVYLTYYPENLLVSDQELLAEYSLRGALARQHDVDIINAFHDCIAMFKKRYGQEEMQRWSVRKLTEPVATLRARILAAQVVIILDVKGERELAITLLAGALFSEDLWCRAGGAVGLARLGHSALKYLPALRSISNDSEEVVRVAAGKAIATIETVNGEDNR